jgi:hypothetical protein
MKTYIDSEEVSSVQFEVVGLSQPFVEGLAGSYILDDFAEHNQSVAIEWGEPDQNFIIIEHDVDEWEEGND